MLYCGREFSEEQIQWIRQQIAGGSGINRRALSIGFCERWGWRKPDGGVKEMSCRVALLKMHRQGLIDLPPAQRPHNKARKHAQRSLLTSPKPPIRKKAGEFDLHLRMAEGAEVKLWNEFIDRYHYLGYSPLPGAQIRYFVKDMEETVALLGFSAAAWKTAPRDRFIGWEALRRTEALHLIVNNSRFLVLPWVESKNLASRILSIAGKTLPRIGRSVMVTGRCSWKRSWKSIALPESATGRPTGSMWAIPRAGENAMSKTSTNCRSRRSGFIP